MKNFMRQLLCIPALLLGMSSVRLNAMEAMGVEEFAAALKQQSADHAVAMTDAITSGADQETLSKLVAEQQAEKEALIARAPKAPKPGPALPTSKPPAMPKQLPENAPAADVSEAKAGQLPGQPKESPVIPESATKPKEVVNPEAKKLEPAEEKPSSKPAEEKPKSKTVAAAESASDKAAKLKGDLASLEAKLERLENEKDELEIDSKEYKAKQREIDTLKGQISRKKALITTLEIGGGALVGLGTVETGLAIYKDFVPSTNQPPEVIIEPIQGSQGDGTSQTTNGKTKAKKTKKSKTKRTQKSKSARQREYELAQQQNEQIAEEESDTTDEETPKKRPAAKKTLNEQINEQVEEEEGHVKPKPAAKTKPAAKKKPVTKTKPRPVVRDESADESDVSDDGESDE